MPLTHPSWLAKARQTLAGIPLAMMGSALIRTWVRCATPHFPSGPVGGAALPGLPAITTDNVFDVVCAITALALAFAARSIAPSFRQPRLTGACTAAMSIASVALGFAAMLDIPWLFAPIALVAGVGFMTMSLTWAELYLSFNPIRMILYYCSAQALSNVFIFALDGYGEPHIFGVLATLPLPSLWALRISVRALRPDDAPLVNQAARPFPWKPAAFVAIYALAYSIAESSSGVLAGYPGLFLYLVPPLLFLIGVIFEPRRFSLRTIYLIVCPVMMCALLLPVAIPSLPQGVSAALISLGYNTSGILGVLILGSISYRLGISALWLLGITRACTYSGVFLGAFFHQTFGAVGGGFSPTLSILLAVCVVVSSTMLLTEKGVNANWRMSPHGQVDAIARARDLYGLTAREEEILCLLAQKKTVPTIATDMFLAQGTVKAHVQHIYQKMGIHSRKELEATLHVK